MFDKKNDTPIIILLIGIAIATLVPFVHTGFATGDDLEFMITARNGTSWHLAEIYAKDAGRFYFYLTKPFYDLPYLIGNLAVIKAINILFVLINFILVGKILSLLFDNKWLKYFTILLALTFVSIKSGNNPVVSFLLYFTANNMEESIKLNETVK